MAVKARAPAAAASADLRSNAGMVPAHDLLMDFAELDSMLRSQLDALRSPEGNQEALLDAFLLAAGMDQVAEDYLHRDVYELAKVAKVLKEVAGPPGAAAAAIARSIRATGLRLRALLRQHRRLVKWQKRFSALVQDLADDLIGPGGSPGLLPHAGTLASLSRAQFPSRLLRQVVSLPNCFQSFDQRPADIQRIAGMFAERWEDRDRPLLVVGIRTSGSYMAPLYAACLKALGYRSIQTLTLRPWQPWLRRERRLVSEFVRADGLVLLVDDPPGSGGSVASCATKLERLGLPHTSLILLLQLFGSLPAALERYEAVVVPWENWTIHEQLEESAVQETLSEILVGRTIREWPSRFVVGAVERVQRIADWAGSSLQRHVRPRTSSQRWHVSALFRVTVTDDSSGEQADHLIYVKGVGLGYYGRHSLDVARRLGSFAPEIYGVRDGLLYRPWLPDEWRLPAKDPNLVSGIAGYVATRSGALAVPADAGQAAEGKEAVWELVAFHLGWALLRRLRPFGRPATWAVVRRLLHVSTPSVSDGRTELSKWFEQPENGSEPRALKKIDFDEHSFSKMGRFCYDPVYDLAGAAADYLRLHATDGDAHRFGDSLRQAYTELSGNPVREERWLLYQIQKLNDVRERSTSRLADAEAAPDGDVNKRAEAHFLDVLAAKRAMGSCHQRYFHRLFFDNVEPAPSGPLCAIDVDGVLETTWLEFPAIGPAGALALRALTAHGYRPVLATGRSVDEVRERCAAYGLAGGVAEYGAAVYDRPSGATRVLLTAAEQDELEQLRGLLNRRPGVHVHPGYRYCVRASRVDDHGDLRGLDEELIGLALAEFGAPGRINVFPGYFQTDFGIARVDKGTGLQALAGDAPIVLAVGDTRADFPMFERSVRSFVPGQAVARLRTLSAGSGVTFEGVRAPLQAGLLAAVSAFLGHRPSRCQTCRPRPRSRDEALLLRMLSGLNGGSRARIGNAFMLALELVASSKR